MVKKQLHIIAYDIRLNRSRTKVSDYLTDAGGVRINRSVFELMLAPRQLPALLAELEQRINPKTDQVAVYPICRACYGRSHYLPERSAPDQAPISVW